MLTTDGRFTEGEEHLGGFHIIKAVDLDAALGRSRGRPEALFPTQIRFGENRPYAVDKAGIGFIDERRRLQRVVPAFVRHVPLRQPLQLVVDQRHQLLERLGLAAAPREKELCRSVFTSTQGLGFQFNTTVIGPVTTFVVLTKKVPSADTS